MFKLAEAYVELSGQDQKLQDMLRRVNTATDATAAKLRSLSSWQGSGGAGLSWERAAPKQLETALASIPTQAAAAEKALGGVGMAARNALAMLLRFTYIMPGLGIAGAIALIAWPFIQLFDVLTGWSERQDAAAKAEDQHTEALKRQEKGLEALNKAYEQSRATREAREEGVKGTILEEKEQDEIDGATKQEKEQLKKLRKDMEKEREIAQQSIDDNMEAGRRRWKNEGGKTYEESEHWLQRAEMAMQGALGLRFGGFEGRHREEYEQRIEQEVRKHAAALAEANRTGAEKNLADMNAEEEAIRQGISEAEEHWQRQAQLVRSDVELREGPQRRADAQAKREKREAKRDQEIEERGERHDEREKELEKRRARLDKELNEPEQFRPKRGGIADLADMIQSKINDNSSEKRREKLLERIKDLDEDIAKNSADFVKALDGIITRFAGVDD